MLCVREIIVLLSIYIGWYEYFVDDFVLIFIKLVIYNILYFGYNFYICFGWIKDVKYFYIKEWEMCWIWLVEGRLRGMIFEFYWNYKCVKRYFRVVLDNEFNNYMKFVYYDFDICSWMWY